MKKMYINYIFNNCTEIFKTANEAVQHAIEKNPDGQCVYLNHYVDDNNGLAGWSAYTGKDGYLDATNMGDTKDWEGLLNWEDEWDEAAEITVEEA